MSNQSQTKPPGRVAVIGGGVVGLCTAYYLSKAGAEVTVIDPRAPHSESCSTGNNGMIVPSHFIPMAAPGMVAKGMKMMLNRRSPFFIKPRLSLDAIRWCMTFMGKATQDHVNRCANVLRDLNLESRKLFEQFADAEGNTFDLKKHGLLMLCNTEKGLEGEAAVAEQAKALGLDVEVLDIAGVRALDPNVEINGIGGVHYREDCHLSPDNFVGKLEAHLAASGVKFLWNTEVSGFTSSGNRITGVIANDTTIPVHHTVLTAGVWSMALGRKLGINLMMQPGKGYSLTLENPTAQPKICAILAEAKVAVTPMGERLRFGGTMEIGGKKDIVDQLRLQGIIDSIPAYYPQFDARQFAGVKPWHGLRPCSPDGMPYLGMSGKWDNLVIGTGHTMMGLSLGPVTGKVLTEFVTHGPGARTLVGCEVDRY